MTQRTFFRPLSPKFRHGRPTFLSPANLLRPPISRHSSWAASWFETKFSKGKQLFLLTINLCLSQWLNFLLQSQPLAVMAVEIFIGIDLQAVYKLLVNDFSLLICFCPVWKVQEQTNFVDHRLGGKIQTTFSPMAWANFMRSPTSSWLQITKKDENVQWLNILNGTKN
jgi:hypothetical protein